jgi:large subunit ribosomal protein L21
MKKAVVELGGKQHLVSEGDEIVVNLLSTDKKTVTLDTLMLIDGKESTVGAPLVKGSSVKAEIIDADSQGEKVLAIRYKSKKRVHKVRGHRQRLTTLKITSIN